MRFIGSNISNYKEHIDEDNNLFLYLSCQCNGNIQSLKQMKILLEQYNIDFLIVGARATYDKNKNRIETDFGLLSQCYIVDECYAILSVHNIEWNEEINNNIVRAMTETDYHFENLLNKKLNVYCLYPCPVTKCLSLVRKYKNSINFYLPDKELMTLDIDQVYYFFSSIIIIVLILLVISAYVNRKYIMNYVRDKESEYSKYFSL